MPDKRTEELIDNLTQQGAETLAFFKGLSAEDWETAVYSEEGDWTVRTLLSHFVWSEQSMEMLYKQIAEGGSGAAEDFDLDRWNQSRARKTADLTPDDLMAKFEDVRASYIAFVKTLDDETLNRRGRHASQGVHSLRGLIHIPYHHVVQHLDDIRNALAGA